MYMKKGIVIGVFALLALFMSSCMRSGSWFPDMDCVTKKVEVVASLSPSQLPPQGGKVPLIVSAEKITHYWQYGKEINSERGPVPFELVLMNNPEGYVLEHVNGRYVLTCPVNNRRTAVQLTLVVVVDGERHSFELTQKPNTYDVNVEIPGEDPDGK